MSADRYLAVLFLRPEDDRRRWLVVDLRPWEGRKSATAARNVGAVVADVMGEGNATRIAEALNKQPTVDPDALAELVELELERRKAAEAGDVDEGERPLVNPHYPAAGRVPLPDPPEPELDADGRRQAF